MNMKNTNYWKIAKKQESIFTHSEKEIEEIEVEKEEPQEPVVPPQPEISSPPPIYPKPLTTRVVNKPPGFTTSSF